MTDSQKKNTTMNHGRKGRFTRGNKAALTAQERVAKAASKARGFEALLEAVNKLATPEAMTNMLATVMQAAMEDGDLALDLFKFMKELRDEDLVKKLKEQWETIASQHSSGPVPVQPLLFAATEAVDGQSPQPPAGAGAGDKV